MTQLKRTSIVEELDGALRSEILEGELPPGSRLREEPLAERFGVSRNTLREALRGLVLGGLVNHRAHRGAAVAQPTADGIREVYRVRRIMEPAGLASLEAGGLQRLAGTASAMEEAATDDDWPAVVDLDIRFHLEVVRGVESDRLDTFYRSLLSTLRLAFIAVDRGHARMAPPAHVAEHRGIVEAQAGGRPDEARTLLVAHLDTAEELLMECMEGREG